MAEKLLHPTTLHLPPAVVAAFSKMDFGQTFLLASLFACTYLFCFVFYRLFLHPLAKYPGPFLGKLTSLHTTWHAYRGDRHLHLYNLHKKYGPIVRFGPNSLSFNSKEALQEIYGHGAMSRKFQKADFYKAFPAVKGVHNTHNAIDKVVHARKRRVLSAAFSDNALRGMEGDMIKHIEELCELIEKQGETETGMDAGEAMSWLSFDVMGEFAFGRTFGMLVDSSQRFVTRMIEMAARNHYICGNFLILHTLNIAKFLFPEIATTRWKYMLHSRQCAEDRMKLHAEGKDADKRDFFHYLLVAADKSTDETFSRPELWGEANVLMIAGSDTTGTALSATLYYLAHNPEVAKKLRNELRDKFTSIDQISMHRGSVLGECHLLRAVVEEAMRLAPSVPGLLPRECIAPGAVIAGVPIPVGTVVGVPIWALHHNPEYHPSPFEFKPERFLSSEDEKDTSAAITRQAYAPFSIGARGCIGKSMAMNELRVTIGRVVWGWEFEYLKEKENWNGLFLSGDAGGKPEFALADGFTSRKAGPWLRFKKVTA